MSYRGLKVAVGLVLALSYGAACGASAPDLIVVQEPIASIPWGQVKSLSFSPDGKYLAITGEPSQWLLIDVVSHPAARKGGSVACWRVADWKRIATPLLDAYFRGDVSGWATAERLVWTPDSTRLIIYDTRSIDPRLNPDKRVSVWSSDGWHLLSTAKSNTKGNYLVSSPDGASYVSRKGNDGINVWDLRTGSLGYSINVIVDPIEISRQPDEAVDIAAYSSDGKWLAVSYGDLVCLIDDATRAVVSRRPMPDRVRGVHFQPDTHNLLVKYGEQSYQLLAAPDLTPVLPPVTVNPSFDLAYVGDVQFSTDGKWFAVRSSFFKNNLNSSLTSVITLVETASMKVFGTIGPVKDFSSKLTLSPDGSMVALTTSETKVYPGDTGRLVVFPTSKPGGPSPDAWIKAHPSSSTPAPDQPALPPKTPPDAPGH